MGFDRIWLGCGRGCWTGGTILGADGMRRDLFLSKQKSRL